MEFKKWLCESTLKDFLDGKIGFKYVVPVDEANIRFKIRGQSGQHVNDLAPDLWKWLDKQMQDPGSYWSKQTPPIQDAETGQHLSRDQVQQLAQLRIQGGKYQGMSSLGGQSAPAAPAAPTQQATAAPQQQSEPWILATSKQTGDKIGMQKVGPSDWKMVSLHDPSQEKVVPAAQTAQLVASDQDASGKPIKAPSFEQLAKIAGIELPKAKSKEKQGKIASTPHQQAIEDSFRNGQHNIMMDALAGTGKTTMLKKLAEQKKPGEKWLYIVFNKKNRVEAKKQGEFPRGVEVHTSHSFLHKVLNDAHKSGTHKHPSFQASSINMNKMFAGMDDPWFEKAAHDLGIPKWGWWDAKQRVAHNTKGIVPLAKKFALDPRKNIHKELQEIAEKYDIDIGLLDTKWNRDQEDFSAEILELAVQALKHSMPGAHPNQQLGQERDQDDTLWYHVIHDDLQFPRYDVVLADEVQDFNRAQSLILQKLKNAGAKRIIVVGDPNQAIYRFNGADANSFGNIKDMLSQMDNGLETHKLPTNFRSGSDIVRFSNDHTHVNNLESPEKNAKTGEPWHKGVVTVDGQDVYGNSENHASSYGQAVEKMSDEWERNKGKLDHETAFVARTNQPLVHTALNFLKNGIKFVVLGRDLSSELDKHIKKVRQHSNGKGWKQVNNDLDEFSEMLSQFNQDMIEKWRGKMAKQADLQEINSTTEALNSVINYLASNGYRDEELNMNVKNVDQLTQYLKKRFAGLDPEDEKDSAKLQNMDPKKYVTLSTSHKSKGLQWYRQYVIDHGAYPHSKAQHPEELEQEENLRYITYTRPTHELHILNSGPEDEKDDDPMPPRNVKW